MLAATFPRKITGLITESTLHTPWKKGKYIYFKDDRKLKSAANTLTQIDQQTLTC